MSSPDPPYRVIVDREPDGLDLAFLEERMADAAVSAVGVGEEEEFAVVVRDDGASSPARPATSGVAGVNCTWCGSRNGSDATAWPEH